LTSALAEQFPGRRLVVELLPFEDDWHISTLRRAHAGGSVGV
jgi:hypothetical protein